MAILKVGNGQTYQGLSAANAAANPGDTIQVMSDLNGPDAVIKSNKSITLDLNGHTLDGEDTYPTGNLVNVCGNGPGEPCEGYCESVGFTWGGLIEANGATGFKALNGKVINSIGTGINVATATGTRITNVDVFNSRHAALRVTDCADTIVDGGEYADNVLFMPCARPLTLVNAPNCVSIRNTDDTVMRNLVVHGAWSGGVILFGDRRSIFEDCIVYDMMRTGVNFSASQDSIVRRNLLIGLPSKYGEGGYGGILSFPEKEETQKVSLRNIAEDNIVIGYNYSVWFGAEGAFATYGTETKDFIVRNNHLLFPRSAVWRLSKTMENCQFYNNLCVKQAGSAAVKAEITTNDTKTTVLSNNLYDGFTAAGSALIDSASDIYAASGMVGGNAAPTVTTDISRYRLLDTSAAIDAGNTAVAATTDYDSAARPVGAAADIGAFESGATTTNPGDPPPITCTTNKLTNGDFASGTANWAQQNLTTFTAAGGILEAAGPATFNQLYQDGASLVAGKTYRVTVVAKLAPDSIGNTIRLRTLQVAAPNANTGLDDAFVLTQDWAVYETTFVAGLTEPSNRFRIRLDDAHVFIDAICFEEVLAEITAVIDLGNPTVAVGEPLTISSGSTSTNGITSTLWDFGDGTTSTAITPSKSYAAPGIYTVTLTVTGPDGTDTTTETITVAGDIQAAITAPAGTVEPGTPATFSSGNSTSDLGITSYLWDFGDGTTSTAANPSHTYTTAGNYTVTLTVTGPDGTSTVTQTVLVGTILVGPQFAEHFVMNGGSTVTQLSSHPVVAQELMPDPLNLMGEYEFSYNVITGLGKIHEDIGQHRTLFFDIDTGKYQIVDEAGTVLSTGTDQRLSIYGGMHPVEGGGARGQAYWTFLQTFWKTCHPDYIAQAWPTLYQAQVDKVTEIKAQ